MEYQIRDRVYLDASDIHTTCPSQKLAHCYLGPFTVTWWVSWNTYQLWPPTPKAWLHPVFNLVKLLQAPEDPILGWKAHPPPPLEIVDGEEHYIVGWVLDSWLMRGQLQFLVKWEGYGYEENSWVPELDIAAPDKIQEFYNSTMHTLVPHDRSIQQPSTPLSPMLQGCNILEGGWCQGMTSFCSEGISEFFQLQPQTSLAFFRLQLPSGPRNTSEFFLFQAPSSNLQHYHALLPPQPLTQYLLQRPLWDLHLLWR